MKTKRRPFICRCADCIRDRVLRKKHKCNLCGQSCHLPGAPDAGPHGLLEVSVNGSFDSTPGNGHGTLDDMTSYTFSVCEFCLDFLFSNMRIAPTTISMCDPEPFIPAADRVKRFRELLIAEGRTPNEKLENAFYKEALRRAGRRRLCSKTRS